MGRGEGAGPLPETRGRIVQLEKKGKKNTCRRGNSSDFPPKKFSSTLPKCVLNKHPNKTGICIRTYVEIEATARDEKVFIGARPRVSAPAPSVAHARARPRKAWSGLAGYVARANGSKHGVILLLKAHGDQLGGGARGHLLVKGKNWDGNFEERKSLRGISWASVQRPDLTYES